MKIYYKIWSDAIIRLRSLPENAGIWKFYSMVFISMAMGFNLAFILFVLAELGIIEKVFFLEVHIFSGNKINGFFDFFIPYMLPFFLINYYCIFYKDKYKKILPKYKYHNGKLAVMYIIGSFTVFIIYFLIAFLIVKVF